MVTWSLDSWGRLCGRSPNLRPIVWATCVVGAAWLGITWIVRATRVVAWTCIVRATCVPAWIGVTCLDALD